MKKVIIGLSCLILLTLTVILFTNARTGTQDVKKATTEVSKDCTKGPSSSTCTKMAGTKAGFCDMAKCKEGKCDMTKCKAGKCDPAVCKTNCTVAKCCIKNCDPAKCATNCAMKSTTKN
jgi:hypothetical protein